MKLTHNEKNLVLAGVKTLYKTVPKDSGEARYYADVYARLTEQDSLDTVSLDFVSQFTERVLALTHKLMTDGLSSDEARLRAEAVNDVYVSIKEKIDAKQ